MTKKALMSVTHISKSTMDKMGRGQPVSMDIIDRVCEAMDCPISDVIEYIRKNEEVLMDYSIVKEKRLEYGISQIKLAKYCGLSPATISSWELGKTIPTASPIGFHNHSTKRIDLFY